MGSVCCSVGFSVGPSDGVGVLHPVKTRRTARTSKRALTHVRVTLLNLYAFTSCSSFFELERHFLHFHYTKRVLSLSIDRITKDLCGSLCNITKKEPLSSRTRGARGEAGTRRTWRTRRTRFGGLFLKVPQAPQNFPNMGLVTLVRRENKPLPLFVR